MNGDEAMIPKIQQIADLGELSLVLVYRGLVALAVQSYPAFVHDA